MTSLIATLFFTALIAPPLAAMVQRCRIVSIGSAMIALTAACCWPVWNGQINWVQWTRCLIVLFSFLLAISFLVLLLVRLGCGRVGSCAIVTILSIAWLSSPVWLSGALAGERLHWWVALHPLFAMNGVVPQLGIWTEQPIAYRLTNIGQDVQYDLPTSIVPIVVVQLSVAGMCLVLAKLFSGGPKGRAVSADRDDQPGPPVRRYWASD